MNESVLWYSQPAEDFNSALPVGNGRIGAMVYGRPENEIIQLNEDSVWSGGKRNRINPDAAEGLHEIRKLILEEKIEEAEELAFRKLQGVTPNCRHYMPLGNFDIKMKLGGEKAKNYRRGLDLETAVAFTEFSVGEAKYKREVFASEPDSIIAVHITSENGLINLSAGLDGRDDYYDDNRPVKKNVILYSGGSGGRGGILFASALSAVSEDGKIYTEGNRLIIENSSNATIILSARTSYYVGEAFEESAVMDIDYASECSFDELYYRHECDYRELYSRVRLTLSDNSDGGSELPTDERILRMRGNDFDDKECDRHIHDNGLMVLYYNFSRYLMISGSRPGSLPLNLQGIWNQDMQPAWSANWTINCNAEINYWPAEITNLSECHFPMFDMIRETSVDGARTAKNLYNSRGWVAHHNLDIWRTTWMVGGTGLYSLFQVGGAWLCQHIWDHYLFTLDEDFLRDHYDLLKSASIFYLDNLQTDRDGYLVMSPSESFENGYIKPNGEKGWACIGSAQDMQIVRALFENTMKSAEILNDGAFKEEVAKAYAKLPPMKISPRTGQLQEWNDDWEPSNPASGQVGHGWAFAVGNQITLRGTPELAQAFRKTIEYRRPGYSYNSGSWTGTFPAVYWARFEEPDSVQRVIDRHFDLALSPNLTCEFMKSWQIDGNLGITTAITEMLLQSHAGEISLLPALPAKYPTGSVTGLRARGGYEVDIFWKDGVLTKAVIKADRTKGDEIIPVRYAGLVKSVKLAKGQTIVLDSSLE